jgi:hypothetical protein
MLTRNKNHYYSSDGKIFDSKIRAMMHRKQTGSKISFYYNDDVYDRVDWKKEPPQTLSYYYLEQAKRIRDNHDYVILFYSGGYDSTNILETFHFNGLKIDKIVIVGAFSQDSQSGVDENHNGELYHNSFPYLKDLGLESITQICDYTKHFEKISNFSVNNFGNEWFDEMGAWFSPHNWFWRDIEKYVVPKTMENKRVAFIWGRDKPALFKNHDGKLGFYFRDKPISSYGNKKDYGTYSFINFYWDPQATDILVKQMHTLKHYMNVYQIPYSSVPVDHVVYNLKRPLIYKSPKSPSPLLSLRDNYLVNKKDSEIFKFYESGVNRLKTMVTQYDLKPVNSKFYAIE